MRTQGTGNFLTRRSWFRAIITEDVVLCGSSALEMLEMFNGLINQDYVEVYALEKGKYENFDYHIVETFDNLDIVQFGNVRCTSFEQTVNDMLSDMYNADIWALTEALSNYYYSHSESFDGLNIRPENMAAFESVREEAINYYNC